MTPFQRLSIQHLRIKAFSGTSQNAVRPRVWTAIAVHALATTVIKRAASGAQSIFDPIDFERSAFQKRLRF